MRIIAIIQARLGSTRLPGKCLMEIAGRPMIDHVLERALAIQGVDQVVLNVPERDVAAFIGVRERYPHANSYVIAGIRQQEQDVLGSYLACAVAEKADVVMRLTGDCWAICPEVSSATLDLFLCGNCDYAANIQPFTTWPDGLDTEVFSMDTLRRSAECAKTDYERQHVTVWARENMRFAYLPCPEDCSKVFLSVNEQKDLDQARRIMPHLAGGYTYHDLLGVLSKEGIWQAA